MIYFTSDHHFWHRNILQYCNRPFANIEVMNAELIARWNTTVSPEDEVYYLGDFGFGNRRRLQPVLDQLVGRKYLISGNHDNGGKRCNGWEWVQIKHDLETEHGTFHLHHYPLVSWPLRGEQRFLLHGHSHGRSRGRQKLDVGVDVHGYCPISLDEVVAYVSNPLSSPLSNMRTST